jgi:predicted phage-related endonuclease
VSARLVLGPDAPREAWLAARLPAVTASESAALPGLAISPFESPFSLYWRKRGQLGEIPDNDAMSLGRHLEPWIADRFERDHPELELELSGLYVSTDRPRQMATPDRNVYINDDIVTAEIACCDLHRFGSPPVYGAMAPCCDPDDCGPCCMDCPTCPTLHPPNPPTALWEGKTSATYEGWGDDGTDDVPAYYRSQVLWQMDVFDLPYAYLSCLFLHSKQVRHYRIDWDAEDVVFMRKAAKDFLAQVAAGNAPPLDSHKATTAALKWLHPKLEDRDQEIDVVLQSAYEQACQAAKAADERKDLLTNELRAAMGDAKYAVHDGEKVATRSVYDQRRADIERLRAEFPDAYAACLKTSTVDKIIPARRTK